MFKPAMKIMKNQMQTETMETAPAGSPAGISMEDSEEQALVAGCRRGDSDSLKRLMVIHSSGVLHLLQNIVGDPSAAEALAQEAFFKAFQNISRFKDGTNLRVWLFTIARNTALDHLRREKRSRVRNVDLEGVPELEDTNMEPASEFEKKEESARIREAVDELPRLEREVVFLRIFEALTWDAISDILKVPEATVRSWMNRALSRLRITLG